MGDTHCYGNGNSRIRVETTVRRGERHIQDVEKVYPHGTELNWSLYSARQGIRSLPAKHVWNDRQNRRMVLVPYEEYQRVMEAQTVQMEDQKPVIKMVTSIAQVAEMTMSEIKRQRDALKPKKKRKPPTRQKPYTTKD